MKLLILSDIHSNADALRAILAKEADADAVYCAGDYVDYGPQPREALTLVRENRINCVRGNHDEHVLRVHAEGAYHDAAPGELTWAKYNCSLMTEEDVSFLKQLPDTLSFCADGVAYLMAHRFSEGYTLIENAYDFDAYWDKHFTLAGCEGMTRRMIFGHTHRQMTMELPGGRSWMNPGSVSYRRPDDPDKDAFYITIENGVPAFHHLPYDRSALFADVQRLRNRLSLAEYRVADFFFGWTSDMGPDLPYKLFNERRIAMAQMASQSANKNADRPIHGR